MTVAEELRISIARLETDRQAADAELIALLRDHSRDVEALRAWLEDERPEPGVRIDYGQWGRLTALLMGREALLKAVRALNESVALLERSKQ